MFVRDLAGKTTKFASLKNKTCKSIDFIALKEYIFPIFLQEG